MIGDGLSDKQIAAQLGISTTTVDKHAAEIARRWNLDPSRTWRVLIAVIVTRCCQRAA